jgi:hypothetical protein
VAVCVLNRPRQRRGQVELDDTTVVDIGEGEQLGYLPETVRQQLGW